jgi:NADH-quinone oxidoreductase subunit N
MDIIILKSFLPEIFFSVAALCQLLFNARLINNFQFNYPLISKEVFIQTIFILFCLFCLLINTKIEGSFSNSLFINDESTKYFKVLLIIITVLSLSIIYRSYVFQQLNFVEYFSILLFALLSLLLLISSNDLLSFYLIIEMQSLCFYILASFKRTSVFSTEAGLKYFISGAFMSGFLLFGCSLLYGALGTLNLHNINLLLAFPFNEFSSELVYLIQGGVLCITATLLFKIACVPFQFWSPDVYDGAPLSSTIVFSIIPKLGLFVFFFRWISSLNNFFPIIQEALCIAGVCSVIVGTLFALSQKRVKRLFIYSSIVQVGFLVCALSTNTLGGITSMFFYLIIYLLTSIVMWGHFALFYNSQNIVNNYYRKKSSSIFISSTSNLFKANPIWLFSFMVILFSVGGIPPLTGFLSKALVLFEIISTGNILVGCILILASSVSVFYYIRFLKTLLFESNTKFIDKENFKVVFVNNNLIGIYSIFTLLLFFILGLFFFPNFLYLGCEYLVLCSSSF